MKKYNFIKTILFLIILLVCSATNFAQNNINNRIYFGGNLGLQFGTYTYIDISPLIGYKLTEKLSVGTGVTYIYFRDNFYDYNTSIYGGRLFSRYRLLENIFTHVEYEVLSREVYDINWDLKRVNVNSFFVGGGYQQMIGGNASLNILVLWNLNETAYSPYQNPIIRVGFGIGL